MYVYFDVDENTILELKQDVREGKIKVQGHGKIPVRNGP